MLVHVLNQWNEAWYEENILRAQQVELEQQISQDLHNKILHKFFSWRESLQEQSRIRLATKYSYTHAHLDLRV
jgi:hypothetical protein